MNSIFNCTHLLNQDTKTQIQYTVDFSPWSKHVKIKTKPCLQKCSFHQFFTLCNLSLSSPRGRYYRYQCKLIRKGILLAVFLLIKKARFFHHNIDEAISNLKLSVVRDKAHYNDQKNCQHFSFNLSNFFTALPKYHHMPNLMLISEIKPHVEDHTTSNVHLIIIGFFRCTFSNYYFSFSQPPVNIDRVG